MKTLEDDECWSYDDLVDSMAVEIVDNVDIGGYQGDTIALLRDGDKYGLLMFGWGSCSVCDALKSCATREEATELRDELWQSIIWYSKPEMADLLAKKDWSLTHIDIEDEYFLTLLTVAKSAVQSRVGKIRKYNDKLDHTVH